MVSYASPNNAPNVFWSVRYRVTRALKSGSDQVAKNRVLYDFIVALFNGLFLGLGFAAVGVGFSGPVEAPRDPAR